MFSGLNFGTGQPIGALFLEEDHLRNSRLFSVIYSSLYKVKASWLCAAQFWHVHH